MGCGGLRRYEDGVAEVKRMYVRPGAPHRRRPRSSTSSTSVPSRSGTDSCSRRGYNEAIALYRSEGYVAIPPYGLYVELGTSRCFAVDLAPQGTSS